MGMPAIVIEHQDGADSRIISSHHTGLAIISTPSALSALR